MGGGTRRCRAFQRGSPCRSDARGLCRQPRGATGADPRPPELAGKAAIDGTLTSASAAEQASAGLNRLTPEEFARFHALNAASIARPCHAFHHLRAADRQGWYPGRDGARRQRHGPEIATALAEIGKITACGWRISMTLAAPALSAPTLSTHVLDTMHGTPAMGMAITLAGPHGLFAQGFTTGWARAIWFGPDRRQAARRAFPADLCVAAYFRARGVLLPDPPFLDEVTIDFNMAPDGGHYHVPLLVTPYGYSTYRGS
jgi:5-hydroxyisourate hydrolase-like protein (transthyretin family)